MKILRQLCAVLVLTLALTATALAGQMDCPGITSSGETPNNITNVILIMLALV